MEVGIGLIIVAVVLFAVGFLLRRQRPSRKDVLEGRVEPGKAAVPTAEPEMAFDRPRPKIVDVRVEGPAALVTFAVPVPDGGDDILTELLLAEAIEAVRERTATLDTTDLREIVAYGHANDGVVEVGRVPLDQPGALPKVADVSGILNFARIAADPLESSLPTSGEVVDLPDGSFEDELAPVGAGLRLPKAIDTGVRAQGVDPSVMTASELVLAVLRLVGYNVESGAAPGTWIGTKGSSRTFIKDEPHEPGSHPELDEGAMNRFLFEFQSSGAERGLLVSDKYGPFAVYDRERRDPRIRFVTRERLQKFVDSVALG